MVGIKFSNSAAPFPSKPGYWIRLTFKDNTLVQGHVLWFRDEEIIDMSNGSVTTIETIREGDKRSAADGVLATYTAIEGIKMTRKAQPAQTAPPATSNGDNSSNGSNGENNSKPDRGPGAGLQQ